MLELPMLQILLEEFHNKIKFVKDLVIRDTQFPDAPNKIKVAIGMRHAGKTYSLSADSKNARWWHTRINYFIYQF